MLLTQANGFWVWKTIVVAIGLRHAAGLDWRRSTLVIVAILLVEMLTQLAMAFALKA